MPVSATTMLLNDAQVAAITDLYHGTLDMKSIAPKYPQLAHHKQPLLSIARGLEEGLGGMKLHREVLKALKLPVPDRSYDDDELRDALVAYHFRGDDKTQIGDITDRFGPSKPTLWRQHKRLIAALALARSGADATHEAVRDVAAAINFPAGGRPTIFTLDEERLLLEMTALHAEHGGGKAKRLQLNYAKRAAAHMASEEEDPKVKARLANAKLSRRWLADVRGRVASAGGEMYKDVKPSLLSQTRAAAKKPGQNLAMFDQIQAKYDELGEAGKLPGCQRDDGHWEPPPWLIYAGDEMGIEPNGKRWSRVLARKDSQLVHRIVTGEHNPFWVTLFFWSRADGGLEIPPMIIHKAAQMRGDLAHGLPMMPGKQWLVRASESGYLTKDDWLLVCAHMKMHIVHRPAFVFFDGFVNHWDADALALLVEDDIHVFCLKSQDSDSDQINDNGPNASVKAGYGRGYDEWLELNPGVPFTPFYLAQQHVALLELGEAALEKLRESKDAKLNNDELRGAITKLGGNAKGNKAELMEELNALLKKPKALALLPPSPPPPALAAPASADAMVVEPTVPPCPYPMAALPTLAQARPRRH